MCVQILHCNFILCRVGWREDQTLSTNYLQNQLVMDPNVDHHGSKQSHKLLPPEERKSRGEETFSDDDGALHGALEAVTWFAHCCGLSNVSCHKKPSDFGTFFA